MLNRKIQNVTPGNDASLDRKDRQLLVTFTPGAGASIKDAALATGHKPSIVPHHIRKLQSRGYIEVVDYEGRTQIFRLTEAGEVLRKRILTAPPLGGVHLTPTPPTTVAQPPEAASQILPESAAPQKQGDYRSELMEILNQLARFLEKYPSSSGALAHLVGQAA